MALAPHFRGESFQGKGHKLRFPLVSRLKLGHQRIEREHVVTKDYSSQTFFIRIDWVGWSLKFLTFLS